jgi:hypothetical protein
MAIYVSNQIRMKHSSDRTILFASKFAFCVATCIWLLPIILLLEREINSSANITHMLPNSRLLIFLMLLPIYFILNKLTWNLKQVKQSLTEEQSEYVVRKYRWLFVLYLITGFVFLISVAKYNQYNPLN